jgi:hypothetical protein
MSSHNHSHTSEDPVEGIVKHIPIVIPVAGAVLHFLAGLHRRLHGLIACHTLGVMQGPQGHDLKPAFGGFFSCLIACAKERAFLFMQVLHSFPRVFTFSCTLFLSASPKIQGQLQAGYIPICFYLSRACWHEIGRFLKSALSLRFACVACSAFQKTILNFGAFP